MVGSGEGKLVKGKGWVGYELVLLRVIFVTDYLGHGLRLIAQITRIIFALDYL
jgi:hypothetical protein